MHSVVVGLGKTGASCVRFLAKRGDRVSVTDTRSAPPGSRRARQAGGGGGPAARRIRSVAARGRVAGADVARRVARRAHRQGSARAGHRRAGRCGTVRARGAGPGDRHHRHQRQEHGDDPGGALRGGSRTARAGRRQSGRARARSARPTQAGFVRARAVELSIGDHLVIGALGRGGAERQRRSPGPLSFGGSVCARQGTHLCEGLDGGAERG